MVQKIPFTSIKASGKISSTGNANIDIEPHGTGDVLIGNFHFDADQSITNSNDNHVLTYDHSGGKISLEAAGGGGEGDNIVTLNQNGNVSLHTGTARWYAPYNLTVNKIDARVDTAPTGSSINITIKKNGTQVTTMSIAASGVKAENTTGFSMNEDDYLTVDTTQIGSTDPGTNLKIIFHYAQA